MLDDLIVIMMLSVMASILVTTVIIATHKYTVGEFTYGVLILLVLIDTGGIIYVTSEPMDVIYTINPMLLHVIYFVTLMNSMFILCLLCNRLDKPDMDTTGIICRLAKFCLSMSSFLIYAIYGIVFMFVDGGVL